MQLHSVSRGDTQNPTVIVIHGLLGASRNLFRLTEAIAAAGFHVLAIDQRGHGHSPHGAPNDYSLRQLASDVFELIDSKDIKAAHFVGHSLGGRVSLAAAGLEPKRVLSLTMLDVGARIHPESLKDLHEIVGPLPESFSSHEEGVAAVSHHSESMQQFLLSNLRNRGDKWSWVFDLSGIRTSLLTALSTDQMPIWSALKCPALLVRGAVSEHFKQSEYQTMLEKNPKAQGVVIPNAEHWLHVDNFGDTSQAVLKFLAEVK